MTIAERINARCSGSHTIVNRVFSRRVYFESGSRTEATGQCPECGLEVQVYQIGKVYKMVEH